MTLLEEIAVVASAVKAPFISAAAGIFGFTEDSFAGISETAAKS
jgi:predicted component of type VI protein secretion system